MIISDKWRDPFAPRFPSECHTGMEMLAAGSLAMSAANTGMSILGGSQQADAQRSQGAIAVRNAKIRQQQAEQQALLFEKEAEQIGVAAGQEQAAAQRAAAEAERRGMLGASRAIAVMSASGGVDKRIAASIIGEGKYAGAVSLYSGDERARGLRNKAAYKRYDAANARWSGAVGVDLAQGDRAAYESKASNTMLSSVVGGGLSLAQKYGGFLAKDGNTADPRYNSIDGLLADQGIDAGMAVDMVA